MEAEVTVLPVPGGPCIKHKGWERDFNKAYFWYGFNIGNRGADIYFYFGG